MCWCNPQIRTPKCHRDECVPKPHQIATTVTIPRDLHDLYKEAAEKWARSRLTTSQLACIECGNFVNHITSAGLLMGDITHSATCKAARILGLKREGA